MSVTSDDRSAVTIAYWYSATLPASPSSIILVNTSIPAHLRLLSALFRNIAADSSAILYSASDGTMLVATFMHSNRMAFPAWLVSDSARFHTSTSTDCISLLTLASPCPNLPSNRNSVTCRNGAGARCTTQFRPSFPSDACFRIFVK